MDGKKELKIGLLYSFIGKYSNIIVSLVISSILARLLSPKEFGIVAVINIFLVFFNNLADMGFGAGVIQKKEIDNKFISSVFYFTSFLGFILSIVFYLFSKYWIVYYYENPIYEKLGILVALNLFLVSIGIVPRALINRKKMFKEFGIINFLSNFLSGILAIVLAYLGFSYYSIVLQGIIMNLLVNLFIILKLKFRIDFSFEIKYIKDIFSYSSYLFIFNFINYFARNLDNILIGKYMGVVSLGFYDKAYKLMIFPLSALTGIINSVLHPVFARYQDNREKIYREYLEIIKILSFLGIMTGNVAYFNAKEIILILYGKNWVDVIPIFKILACAIFIQVVLSTTGSIFLALGRSDKMFFSGLFYSGGLIIAIILGIYRNSLKDLTIFLVIAFIFGYMAIYKVMLDIFEKSFIKFLFEFKYSYLTGIFLILVNIFILGKMIIDNVFLSFFIKSMVNIGITLGIMKYIYFKDKSIKEIIKIIKN